VLSDEQARRRYDMYGKAGVGGGGGGGRGGGGGFGGGGGNTHSFNFGRRSANDIFKDAFGEEDPFASFEKEFAKGSEGGGGGGMGRGGARVRMGGSMGGASSSFSSSFSFSMGGGGGVQKTMQRSETRIDASGRRVTKTIKTSRDGKTEAEMELDDGKGNVRSRRVGADGDKEEAKPASLADKEAPPAASKPTKEPETPPTEGKKRKSKTKSTKGNKAKKADADL
jgi:DnaJ-class molecular chaperone